MAALFVVKLKVNYIRRLLWLDVGKKMAKGGMMKEEKMMKREGRGMAKADMQKMAKCGDGKLQLAYGERLQMKTARAMPQSCLQRSR
jgi:hypothetical protein